MHPVNRLKRNGEAPEAVTAKKRRRKRLALAMLLLLVGGGYWSLPSSQMARVRQMQEELANTPRDQLTAEERKQKFEALPTEQEKLTSDERVQLRKEMGKRFQKKMNAEAIKYLSMSPAERKKIIDQRIAREQNRGKKGPQGSSAAGVAKGNGGTQGALGANRPVQGSAGKALSPEDRDELRREFLLHAAPQAHRY